MEKPVFIRGLFLLSGAFLTHLNEWKWLMEVNLEADSVSRCNHSLGMWGNFPCYLRTFMNLY